MVYLSKIFINIYIFNIYNFISNKSKINLPSHLDVMEIINAIINGIRTADINAGVRNRRDGEHLLGLMLLFFNSFTACTVLSR